MTVRVAPLGTQALLLRQREANEALLLAALRAEADVEDARVARLAAESEATSLRKIEVELRATAELRERLIGIIGHDLRNPLNSIVMAGGILVGRDLCPHDARLANLIVASAHRMAKMISQLVAFTRARMGGVFTLSPSRIDLRDVCQSIVDEASVAAMRDILLTAEGDLMGTWDFDLLAEALSNLLGNAIDHGTGGTQVSIDCRAVGDDACVAVTNCGPEIPPELLPRIFEAFRRAEGEGTSRVGHLGLGLYIAHEIVCAHHGTITVRSSEGSTTFTVHLPRSALSPSAD